MHLSYQMLEKGMLYLPYSFTQNSWSTHLYILYISKGLQCALTAITIVALWQLPHLGHGMCAYTLFGLHCEVTRVLRL